jgi:hypothetical protein
MQYGNLAFKLLPTTSTTSFTLTVGGTNYTWNTADSLGATTNTLTADYRIKIIALNSGAIAPNTLITVKVGDKYSASMTTTAAFLASSNWYIWTEDSVFVTVKEVTSFNVNSQDYSQSKFDLGQIVPENAIASVWGRLEPLITPEQLKVRHLFGIPLVSRTKDPITGKPMVYTDDILKDMIVRAVSLTEIEANFDIFPVKYREKTAFDRNAFDSFGYMELKRRPVSSVDRLTVTPSNQVDVYQVPQAWIEASGFQRGQVNIVPLTIAFTNGGFIPSQSAGGAAFLSILGAKGWIPAYWQIEYTTGFPDGMLPRELNELIGVVAAIETLSSLATTDADATSRSLSIDGLGQSVGGPGPQKYQTRIELLMQKKQMLIDKFKGKFALKMFSSNV